MLFFFFFFKQKTAYEMVRSDWSSDVCSSDLPWFHGTGRPKLVVPAGAAVVKISQYKFATDTVRIPAGATVVWANDDVAEHTVTFDGTEPGSPTIPPGGAFSHQFDRPGTYSYHCTPHPFMKGVVIVR